MQRVLYTHKCQHGSVQRDSVHNDGIQENPIKEFEISNERTLVIIAEGNNVRTSSGMKNIDLT